MGDIKLFALQAGLAKELVGSAADIEKQVQQLIEANMETLLGVRFLASEYGTGKTHAGRIDSLGVDENDCPVIVEYKRYTNENVISQGLFYLDWLLDHKAEFRELVIKKFGQGSADVLEWDSTRLLCIAADFTRYDQYAVKQIPRNIELIRYRRFGEDLLLLEAVNSAIAAEAVSSTNGHSKAEKSHKEQIEHAPQMLAELFESLRSYINSLGDDVDEKQLKHYTAFRRLKNVACVAIMPQDPQIKMWLKVDLESYTPEEKFSRDVTSIGHHGTGNLEVIIRNQADLEKAKPLILQSYEGN